MALMRKRSVKQMSELFGKCKGTDIGLKTQGTYNKMPNTVYSDNPFSGSRKISTIEDYIDIENESIQSFSQFNEGNKSKIDYINNALELSDNEKGVSKIRKHINNLIDELPEDKKKDYKKNDWKHGVKLISKELGKEELNKLHKMVEDEVLVEPVKEGNEEYEKQILNSVRDFSHWKDQQQNLRERGTMMGYEVEVGNIKGQVNRIKDNKVYINATTGKEEVVSLKELLKSYKPKKEDKKVHKLELNGPDNGTQPLETSKKSVVSLKLNDKSDKSKDNKITDKNTDEKVLKLKSFNEM